MGSLKVHEVYALSQKNLDGGLTPASTAPQASVACACYAAGCDKLDLQLSGYDSVRCNLVNSIYFQHLIAYLRLKIMLFSKLVAFLFFVCICECCFSDDEIIESYWVLGPGDNFVKLSHCKRITDNSIMHVLRVDDEGLNDPSLLLPTCFFNFTIRFHALQIAAVDHQGNTYNFNISSSDFSHMNSSSK